MRPRLQGRPAYSKGAGQMCCTVMTQEAPGSPLSCVTRDCDWQYPPALNSPSPPLLPPSLPDMLINLLGDLKSLTYHRDTRMKCFCLSSIFTPLEIVAACAVTLGQHDSGWWKLTINTCFGRLEYHQFKKIRLTFLFKLKNTQLYKV